MNQRTKNVGGAITTQLNNCLVSVLNVLSAIFFLENGVIETAAAAAMMSNAKSPNPGSDSATKRINKVISQKSKFMITILTDSFMLINYVRFGFLVLVDSFCSLLDHHRKHSPG